MPVPVESVVFVDGVPDEPDRPGDCESVPGEDEPLVFVDDLDVVVEPVLLIVLPVPPPPDPVAW